MKKIATILIVPVFLAACVPGGIGRTVKFEKPDIKDDFCGVHINFQYCKCAFHNDFCDAIGLKKGAANSHVQAEYKKWLDEQREQFAQACLLAGGIDQGDKCAYCKEGLVAQNDECVPLEEKKPEFQADGPLTNECEIIPEQFDPDWKKYSDIDERIAFNDRSFEAKQALTSYDAMIDLMIEGFELERDMELEQQMIAELGVYRVALVNNIKTNLLKAFWRLSWVTYKTIEGGKGLGGSYKTLLTTGSTVEAIGSGLKVVQGLTPGDSALAIDTKTLSGKARSIGANAALEAIDSLGDPVKIATEIFKSSANAPLPSADLSPEEINILKDQHITKGVVDEILAESQAANAQRAARIAEIESDIIELQKEIEAFEGLEKQRVKVSLEESCKDLKKQFEQDNQ